MVWGTEVVTLVGLLLIVLRKGRKSAWIRIIREREGLRGRGLKRLFINRNSFSCIYINKYEGWGVDIFEDTILLILSKIY